MSEAVAVALISAAVAAGGAGITFVAAQLVRLNRRIVKLEHRDRLSWLYIRELIDHAYRHNALPLPEPPRGWLEDDGT